MIADYQHNVGKLGKVKVHSYDDQWKGVVMFMLRRECTNTNSKYFHLYQHA